MKKLLTFCGILAVVGAIGIGIHAADHIDAPAVTGDGTGIASDITDLYAFQSPSNPDNRVLLLIPTVCFHPMQQPMLRLIPT